MEPHRAARRRRLPLVASICLVIVAIAAAGALMVSVLGWFGIG
jgi:hypothetical protein